MAPLACQIRLLSLHRSAPYGSEVCRIVQHAEHRAAGLSSQGVITGVNKHRPGTKPNSIYPTLGRLVEEGDIRKVGSGREALYFPKEGK